MAGDNVFLLEIAAGLRATLERESRRWVCCLGAALHHAQTNCNKQLEDGRTGLG